MYCWKCGASIRDDANFCPICGSSMETPADAERNCRECGAQLQKSEDSCIQCVTAASEVNDGPLLADGINQAASADAVATDYKGVPCSFSTSKDKKEAKKGVLSGFFSIDGKSLAYVVWILPLKLLLWNLLNIFICAYLTEIGLSLRYIKPEEIAVLIFLCTFGISYPCAVMYAVKTSSGSDTGKFLAQVFAIICTAFFMLAVGVFAIETELGLLYGITYLAVGFVVIKQMVNAPEKR